MPTNNHESTLQRATKEYMELYQAKYGELLSDLEATKHSLRLINLFRLIIRDKNEV